MISNATNPHQYDNPEIDWRFLGDENSSSRKYFRESLESVITTQSLQGKKVLDVGSGIGQLFNWLKEKGAASVTGIDPSTRNIAIAKEKYSWATSVQSTLEDFAKTSEEKFDVIVAILVFEHIRNLDEAFRDIASLLVPDGMFYLIIGDKEYHLGGSDSFQDLGDGTVETKTTYENGTETPNIIYDIFRPIEQVRDAAVRNNLEIVTEQPLMAPMSVPVAERTTLICHLSVFKK